jgi:hypothetical protein
MTKRNIIVAGIVLVILIAITIALGGGKAFPVSIGELHLHTLNLDHLDLRQASLDLQLLDKSPVQLTVALNSKLNDKLNNKLDDKLNNKLNDKLNKLNVKLNNKLGDKLNSQLDVLTLDSLTADTGGLALQFDLAGHLKDDAPLAVLGGDLAGKLLSA